MPCRSMPQKLCKELVLELCKQDVGYRAELHLAYTRSGYRTDSAAASSPSSRSPSTNATYRQPCLSSQSPVHHSPFVAVHILSRLARLMGLSGRVEVGADTMSLQVRFGWIRMSGECLGAYTGWFLGTWAEVRRLLISFGTILMGVRPGLTTDTLMNSPPKSTAISGPAHTAVICAKPQRLSL